ncbi:MAG: iron ABC transporter substrate-binding protein [Aggregatilineales bacterium]
MKHLSRVGLILLLLSSFAVSLSAQDAETLTIYSGRSESLIAPVLEQFTEATGIEVEVRYAGTSEMAAQILEEGDNSPADVFIAQDAGALGALAKADLLADLPESITEQVANPAFASPDNVWVAISGRARVFVYNPAMLAENDLELPASILDLTGDEWAGLVGWAPENASFQSNVTAMRVLLGDDATIEWLEGMVANGTKSYPKNTPVVQATIDGEIVGGLVNHYYLYRFLAEDPDIETTLHFFPGGDAGALVNIAGAGILKTSDKQTLAQELINYLLSEAGQTYFAEETYEYPVTADVEPSVEIIALADIEIPEIDLSDLDDLQGTLDIIEDSGALDN